MRGWRDVSSGNTPAGLTASARTPEGVSWLHLMLLAAHFRIILRAGIARLVTEFLELSGLSAFVGVSDGRQHALGAAVETAVVAVADEQRTALAESMAPRQVDGGRGRNLIVRDLLNRVQSEMLTFE